jgi:hypothetical protein
MVKIHGFKFYDEPGSCGCCPAFNNGTTTINNGGELGHCLLFDEWHKRWCTTPRRCAKLFKSALKYPDGTELVVVASDKNK